MERGIGCYRRLVYTVRYNRRVGKEAEGVIKFTLARNVNRSEYRIW